MKRHSAKSRTDGKTGAGGLWPWARRLAVSLFRFLSSVRLAIPLLLTLIVVVAYGTVLESQYNAEMARLVVYRNTWFQVLLTLLWLNILCAALSRLPWKRHHTGFVITHLGLLILLAGAMITNLWGIDGQLVVAEHSTNNEVSLPDLVLEWVNEANGSVQTAAVSRSLTAKELSGLGALNSQTAGQITVLNYLPFARASKILVQEDTAQKTGPVALLFGLKSAFFDVHDNLHSDEKPSTQLGPAHLALIVHDGPEATQASVKDKQKRPPAVAKSDEPTLQVFAVGKTSPVASIPVRKLKLGPLELGPVWIGLSQVFQQAMVGGNNKIVEGGKPGANPALELSIVHQNQRVREIVFSRFPDFSMNKNGVFGFTFRYLNETPDTGAPADAMPQDSIHAGVSHSARSPSSHEPQGNQIEFHYFRHKPDEINLTLRKGQVEVLNKTLRRGDQVQTPWMGITLTLENLLTNAREEEQVSQAEPETSTELPPSAVQIKVPGTSPPFWLMEEQSHRVQRGDAPIHVFYGHRVFRLPFKLQLEKFSKVDYPGTRTPLSFESQVRVNGEGPGIRVAMNEPLKQDGFTLYQSSYQLRPGEPALSVFSVNWDPGRWIKYLGSLVLVVGIVTFTLMRSRLARKSGRTR